MPIPEPEFISIPVASGGRVVVQPLSLGCGLTVISEDGNTATVFLASDSRLAVIRAMTEVPE